MSLLFRFITYTLLYASKTWENLKETCFAEIPNPKSEVQTNETTITLVTDTPDEQTGGDSSKSNSITSEHSIHSMGVSASSQSSSTNSLPLPNADNNDYSSGSVRNRHKVTAGGVTANLLEHGANNFATIRTTSIVTKQQKEHMQEEMHEQMSGYKRMRREHQGALVRIETTFYPTFSRSGRA